MFGPILGQDRGFLVMTEFFWFCVVTWLSGLMQLLGRDIVFPCRDSVLLLFRDNVTIEFSLSRPRWSQQEVRCCNLYVATGLALARDSMSRKAIFIS